MKVIIAIIALWVAACTPPVRQPPVPGRVAMVGDSILVQAFGFGGDLRGADVAGKATAGWQTRDVLPRITQDVAGASTSPEVLVVQLGHNMAMHTYGSVERNELTTLAFVPHSSSCVLFVLQYGDPSLPQEWRDNLAEIRAHMLYLAEFRPNTHTVDWAEVVAQHPEYLAADLLHLNAWVDNNPAPAAVAYMDTVWQGVEQCD